ncbi:nitrate reductase [Desulfitobacterium sp.]|uniref:molybdopterin oxidoreductase family protein n=1 Tax=Desulfitobacterium sp. TaxID=49981 RepID=UPI002BCCD12C|nr:nitrate reductase [Desulfitobacterium sp.]HVJ48819.1 nitrate reductase [Desulfitobacterium sp.]
MDKETSIKSALSILQDRFVTRSSSDQVPDEWVYSTCGYCAVGCGLYIGVKDGKAVAVEGNPDSPVNRGHLCVKGLYEWKVLDHPERATTPMIRKNGELVPASWEEALSLLTEKIKANLEQVGPEAVGIYHTGQFLLEEYYALGKLAKGVIGTPNIDSNTRLCMSAAVQGYIRSFGTDGPPGCYDDLDQAEVLLIFGANPAEMHPQLWQRILNHREREGCTIIVADPRLTLPAEVADLHLALRPGSNVALLNSLMYVIFKEDLLDLDYIRNSTFGFEELRQTVLAYPPEIGESLTGVPAEKIVEAARIFGRAKTATTLFCQGVNQSMSATDTVTLISSLHLITGKIGKPGCAPFSLTGQSSAMSNREVGGNTYLPGYRNPANPKHRQEVAEFWGIDSQVLPTQVQDIMSMFKAIEQGKLNFLWTMGTNPAVSLPDQGYVRELLDKVFLVVQDVYYPMETAKYADIFLPAAQWGEKTGTVTNSERRVNLACKAVEPPGEGKSDFEIIQAVAKRLGAEPLFSWRNTEEAFQEWQCLSQGRPNDMSGMSYAQIEREQGMVWPCTNGEPDGIIQAKRLYTEGRFNTAPEISQAYGAFNHPAGRAKLWGIPYQEPPEIPDAQFPFWLNTGRIIEQYHTRTKTKRVAELDISAPEGFVEINPEDAQKLRIQDDEKIRLTSRRGWIIVSAHIKNSVSPGQIFVPFHFGDLDPSEAHLKQAANHLTLNWVDPLSKQPIFKVASCRIDKIVKLT